MAVVPGGPEKVASCLVLGGGSGHKGSPATPDVLWPALDDAWQEAFRQAWEAFRTGNIAIGACANYPGRRNGSRCPQPHSGSPRARRRDPRVEELLRAGGEARSLDLVKDLEAAGEVPRLAAMEVPEALGYLWPRLTAFRQAPRPRQWVRGR